MSEFADLKDWREMIGIAGAWEGQLTGVRRFLDFTGQELESLAMLPSIPEEVQFQLSSIASEMSRAKTFIEGYLACQRTVPLLIPPENDMLREFEECAPPLPDPPCPRDYKKAMESNIAASPPSHGPDNRRDG